MRLTVLVRQARAHGTRFTHETLEPAKVSGTPVFEAWLEKLDPSLGEDFGWQRIARGVTVTATRPRPTGTCGDARGAVERQRHDALVAELTDAMTRVEP